MISNNNVIAWIGTVNHRHRHPPHGLRGQQMTTQHAETEPTTTPSGSPSSLILRLPPPLRRPSHSLWWGPDSAGQTVSIRPNPPQPTALSEHSENAPLPAGLWSAVSSQQSAVSSQQSAVSSQQSAVSSQRSAVSSQQSAVSSQRSAVSSQQSAVRSQQSAVSSQRSAVSSQRSAVVAWPGGTSGQYPYTVGVYKTRLDSD